MEWLLEKQADLIIMDMIMDPGMSGIQTFKRIISRNSEQKVILLSGYANSLNVEEALELGIKRFLKKPCTLNTLSRAIRETLEA